jgi:hypothetical protein
VRLIKGDPAKVKSKASISIDDFLETEASQWMVVPFAQLTLFLLVCIELYHVQSDSLYRQAHDNALV